MVDVKTCLDNAQEKMDMAVMYLEEALAHIRAGKASTRLLDGIRVDSYGSMVPISNVAALSTPDARSITIKPWDKSMFRAIEKAIIDSDLGIMPENNGEVIRIGIPPLTEERRRQLAKQCKAEGETAKVSVRNARRDGIDALKKAVKDGLAEDEQKNAEAKLQKIHDKYSSYSAGHLRHAGSRVYCPPALHCALTAQYDTHLSAPDRYSAENQHKSNHLQNASAQNGAP